MCIQQVHGVTDRCQSYDDTLDKMRRSNANVYHNRYYAGVHWYNLIWDDASRGWDMCVNH